MENFLQRTLRLMADGLEEFLKDPPGYAANASLGAVRDYWDMGASVLAAVAFNDCGGLGTARPFVEIYGANAGICGGALKGGNVLARNLYAGLAAFCASYPTGADSLAACADYGWAALLGCAALCLDGDEEPCAALPHDSETYGQ